MAKDELNELNEEELEENIQEEDVDENAEKIAERGRDLELFVLLLFATRLKQIGETGKIIPEAQRKKDLQEIESRVHQFDVLEKADANRLLELVMQIAYADVEFYYAYRSIAHPPLRKNKPLNDILNSVQETVLKDNLFKTQAFMLRNPKNRKQLIPTPLSEAYNRVINEAAEQVTNGLGDYTSAIRQTVKDLTDAGLQTVEYDTPSGKPYHQNTEAAVKRNILDNIRDIEQKTQDEVGKQFDADGKEISVHEYSAPDHEPIQGHQFTNEEYDKVQNEQDFVDYKGRKFQAIKRAIGTLNCRHFTYSIILGIKKPNFTDKELDDKIKRNHQGYTDKNGKHRTMYECTQEQRRLEREVRRNKTGVMVAVTAGDMALARQYQLKVDRYVQQYVDFSNACGLEIHGDKLNVPGYRKVKT